MKPSYHVELNKELRQTEVLGIDYENKTTKALALPAEAYETVCKIVDWLNAPNSED